MHRADCCSQAEPAAAIAEVRDGGDDDRPDGAVYMYAGACMHHIDCDDGPDARTYMVALVQSPQIDLFFIHTSIPS